MNGMNFAAGAGKGPDLDNNLLPNNQLAFVIVNYRAHKMSQSSPAKYLDLELTIDQGQPYAGRKLWTNVGDPFCQDNSEEYRQMGFNSICRMLEAGRGAGPNNPAAYDIGAYPQGFANLNGLRVAVRVGIEKGRDGYQDKNKIIEFLSPNPESSSFKYWEMLVKGVFNSTEAKKVQTPQTGFAASGNGAAVGHQPSLLPPSSQPSAAIPGGFAVPPAGTAPMVPPPPGFAAPLTSVPPATAPAGNVAGFPSNPQAAPQPQAQNFNQAPGWMGQQK